MKHEDCKTTIKRLKCELNHEKEKGHCAQKRADYWHKVSCVLFAILGYILIAGLSVLVICLATKI